MKILFALPGLHRTDRGAEIAFISIADALAKRGHDVILAGSGLERQGSSYHFVHVPSLSRRYFERFPTMPIFRDVTTYEDLTFAPGLLWKYRPSAFDVTVTCSFPFTNWMLRRPTFGGSRPPHVFVTQNGDWPARSNDAEYKTFGCEGLVCTNPDFYEMNKNNWFSALIPNGVDTERFRNGRSNRAKFNLPADRKIVLMVSAFIESKRIDVAIDALSQLHDVHLVVAGDGPLRDAIRAKARQLLPDRFTQLTLDSAEMPDLYRSSDIFLHMSFEESFGNIFPEAMASGIPIIAHDSPRLRWIIGENGTLLNSRNIDEIASSVAQITAPTSPFRKKLQQAASRFEWTHIGAEYEHFLGQVISRSSNRSTITLNRIGA